MEPREHGGGRLRREEFASWAEYYAAYQMALAARYLIPFLEVSGIVVDGASVLDVGCGDGGGTAAFAERASRAVGVDIGDFPWRDGPNLTFIRGDILDRATASFLARDFDLVVLRDVIEHVVRKDDLVCHVKGAMRPGGHALVTFPPYYSPFGAHQQAELKESALSRVPFVHAHPRLSHVRRSRMTIDGFEELAARHDMRIVARRLYCLRPSFRLRYGLPVLRFPASRLRGLREVCCTGAYYVVRKSE
jgi:SAM-dependent methyltransferase